MKTLSAGAARAFWGAVVWMAISSATAFDLHIPTSRRGPPESALSHFLAKPRDPTSSMPPAKHAESAKVRPFSPKLPLSFEAYGDGSQPGFVARGGGYALYLAPGEAVLHLSTNSPAKNGAASSVVRMKFAGANRNARMEAVDRLPGVSNYYFGSDPAKWRTGVEQFAKVRFHELYDGIDVIFYGKGRQLEYDLVVRPGADPNQIRIELEGADKTTLDQSGNLLLQTAAGPLRLRKPLVYQETGATREEVTARFALHAIEPHSGAARSHPQVSFEVAKYDTSRPLVIDPIFDFIASFGGTMRDEAFGISVSRSGVICVVGSTSSIDFPSAASAAAQTVPAAPADFPSVDAWIAFLNRDGTELIASTYFGGTGNDEALAVAVDAFGVAHVTGYTQSNDFPTHGSFFRPYGGLGDAFMAAFSLTGASLYAFYLGGNGIDQGNGIAVGPDGSVYFSGWTRSTNLPVVNALQQTNAGGIDFFIAKFNPGAGLFDYLTYHGSASHEHLAGNFANNSSDPSGGIAVDPAGNAYVTGGTLSTLFPTVNGYRTSGGGAFLSTLNPSGSALTYSTTIGGGAGYGIDVNDSGHAFLAGVTTSPIFPVRNAFQPNYGGSGDAFLAQIDTTKSGDASLMYSSYLGGDGEDEAYAVVRIPLLGDQDRVAVVGSTNSTSFPGATLRSGSSILTSPDGATWSKANQGLTSADPQFSAVKVNCIAVDPTNAQLAYAGTESAGLFKTVNGGNSWIPSSTGLEGSITALALEPGNSSRIYAGTFQNGIYLSEDAGLSWTPKNSGLQTNAPFVSFAFAPGAIYAASDFNGVFKTTNGAMTWTAMNTGLADLRIQALAIDPSDSNILLAGTGGRSSPSGIYMTLNGGASWSLKNGNLASVMAPSSLADFYVPALVILPNPARTILALVESGFERIGGLAKSTDDGLTWEALARFGDPAQTFNTSTGYSAFTASVLGVDPTNPNHILIGTNANSGRGILKSTDGGATWNSGGPVGTTVSAFDVGLTAGNLTAWYTVNDGGDDGFVSTVSLDGAAPSTEIVGGTAQEELHAVDGGEGLNSLGSVGTSFGSELGTGLIPPPNSIPPGPIVPPVEPQNAIVVARPTGTPPGKQADLSITKELRIGDSFGRTGVVCTIEVTNNSSDTTATGVQVNEFGDNFSSGVDTTHTGLPVSVSGTGGNILTLEVGDLAPGAKKQIELFYPVYDSDGSDLGQTRFNIVEVAMIVPGGNDVFDPVAENDIARDEIAVPETPPAPVPPQTANESTRVRVGTNGQEAIVGTIITGSQQTQRRTHRPEQAANQKKVIFRAIGPSLQANGNPLPGRLADPYLEIHDASGATVATNDNWKQTQIGGLITGDQVAEIQASTIPPTDDLESAIVLTVPPASYTAVMRGANGASGIGVAEIYDLDPGGAARLANISTRGFVDTGDNAMIGGIILLGNDSQRIVFRAIGPSLTQFGVPGALQDPTIEVRDSNGGVVAQNDNWRTAQEAALISAGLQPSNEAESAVLVTLAPAAYTAIVRGSGDTTGVALVEVYNLGP